MEEKGQKLQGSIGRITELRKVEIKGVHKDSTIMYLHQHQC